MESVGKTIMRAVAIMKCVKGELARFSFSRHQASLRTNAALSFMGLACLTFLVSGICCLLLGTGEAHATYADYDTESPAQQEMGTYGDPIYPQEIPDGVYEVHARTSSRMCVLYASEADANSNSNKERCKILVENGKITTVFYISKMYNRLCLGATAQEAAAMTNEDGTDDSSYLTGEPAEGYVPHLYTMEIPALNYPMYFASFAGAKYPYDPDPDSEWNTRAKWYSRTVVFTPTDEVMEAIARGSSGGDEGEGDDPADGGGDSDDDNSGGNDSAGEDPDNDDLDEDNQAEQDEPDPQPTGIPQASSSTSNQDQQSSDVASATEEESGGGTGSGGAGVRHGILISPVGFDLPEGDGSDAIVPEMIEQEQNGPTLAEIAAAVMAAMLCAGIIWRVVAFNAGKRSKLPGS